MRTILRYLGPHGPWGPSGGAIAAIGVILFAVVIVGPPLVFVFTRAFGWWWRLWL